jgi:phospholipid-binding lipoprotein MlaA
VRHRHFASLAVGVCIAAQPVLAAAAQTPGDPLESTNRKFFNSQSGFDKHVFRPVAHVYQRLTPGPIGKAIHNVLTNLSEPLVIVNDLLQLRLKRAGQDTLRLTANTTAGWLGLMDVATPGGLPHHDNDFGVTLGRWGVGPGPYLYLPFVGPSTVRDAVGLGVDTAASPFNWVSFPHQTVVLVSQQVVETLDQRVQTEAEQDTLLRDAADPYATLRSVYLQNRESLVRGEKATPPLPPIDTEAPTPDISQPPATTPPSSSQAPPPPAPSPSSNLDAPATLASDTPIATARDYGPQIAVALQPAPPAA